MNYEILTAELTNDPLGRGYSAMTDAEAAADLVTAYRNRRNLVPLWRIAEMARTQGWWLLTKAATENPAAVAFMDYYADPRFENLDMDLTATKNAMAGLVAGSLITQPQADAVDALANETVSRATELGLSGVTEGRVHTARLLIQQGRAA